MGAEIWDAGLCDKPFGMQACVVIWDAGLSDKPFGMQAYVINYARARGWNG